MVISELQRHLNAVIQKHGDIEVVVEDADTGWLLMIAEKDIGVYSDEDGIRLEIGPDYTGPYLK